MPPVSTERSLRAHSLRICSGSRSGWSVMGRLKVAGKLNWSIVLRSARDGDDRGNPRAGEVNDAGQWSPGSHGMTPSDTGRAPGVAGWKSARQTPPHPTRRRRRRQRAGHAQRRFDAASQQAAEGRHSVLFTRHAFANSSRIACLPACSVLAIIRRMSNERKCCLPQTRKSESATRSSTNGRRVGTQWDARVVGLAGRGHVKKSCARVLRRKTVFTVLGKTQ
jgi:hypothetical protein